MLAARAGQTPRSTRYNRRSTIWILAVVLSRLVANAAGTDSHPGIVVDEITRDSAAAKAGIQPGDSLLHWSRGDTNGAIQSPFDLARLQIKQSLRGEVEIEGLRGSEIYHWTLGPEDWGIRSRPDIPQNLLAGFLQGRKLVKPANFPKRMSSGMLLPSMQKSISRRRP